MHKIYKNTSRIINIYNYIYNNQNNTNISYGCICKTIVTNKNLQKR